MVALSALSSLYFEESPQALNRLGDLEYGQIELSAPSIGDTMQINAAKPDEFAKLHITVDDERIAVERVGAPIQVEVCLPLDKTADLHS